MYSRILLAFLFSLSAGCATAPSKVEEPLYSLKFGMFTGHTMDQLRVATETRVIPKRVDTALPYYGFELSRSDRKPYTLQEIVFPPGPPTQIKGEFLGVPEAWADGIKSKAHTFVGNATKGYKFNAGDPIGRYKIVVLMDGSEVYTVEYEIVDSQP